MKNRLERRYGMGGLHFITFSCYRRKPLLGTNRARDVFLKILAEVRDRYDFALIGYVVMPEHVHLLMSDPTVGTPATVMQVLKQRVSRAMPKRRRTPTGQLRPWDEEPASREKVFWQRRFYDFNVWSEKKRNEKMNYMHFNPVKRGLVEYPKGWDWSSWIYYAKGTVGLCRPNPEWQPKKLVGKSTKMLETVRVKTRTLSKTERGAAPSR